MADYTAVTWVTDDTLTAAQITELSSQINEEEALNHIQSDLLDRLAVGMTTIPRWFATTSVALTTSGNMNLTYFTADQTATWAQVTIRSGGTAAGATPTLVRWGLYSEAGNGDLTLQASIASDTTLFAAANTTYTKSITTPYAVTKGSRYASAILVVSAAAIPSIVGSVFTATAGTETLSVAPRLAAVITGQSNLPSSLTNATVAAGTAAAPMYTRIF